MATVKIGSRVTWGAKRISFVVTGINTDEVVYMDPTSGIFAESGASFEAAYVPTARLKDIELVSSANKQCSTCAAAGAGAACGSCGKETAIGHQSAAVKSDGGSSSYYHIPKDAEDLQDLIEAKEMSFARANIFKAVYRMGEKDGADVIYDINKIIWFACRLRGMLDKGQRV